MAANLLDFVTLPMANKPQASPMGTQVVMGVGGAEVTPWDQF